MLYRQSARRLLNLALAEGWAAWVDMWEARRHALRWLRECANRLRTPRLADAF